MSFEPKSTLRKWLLERLVCGLHLRRNLMSRRIFICGVAVLTLAGAIASYNLWLAQEPAVERQRVEPERPISVGYIPQGSPSILCSFYNLTHTSTVVSFYFGIDDTTAVHPKFTEIFVEDGARGSREVFDKNERPQPEWSFAIDDGNPAITSPGAKTKIIIYGLKFEEPGVILVEAGLRDNDYRNLEGQCRQAYLASSTNKPGR